MRREVRSATRARVFPGGAIPPFARFVEEVRARWPFLGEARAARMAHAYGAELTTMLAHVEAERDMGAAFGAGLTGIEARWMRDREWARAPEDALERRSKLGLHMTEGERAAFANWWNTTWPV